MKHKFSVLRWMMIFVIVLAALPINVFAYENDETTTISEAITAVQSQYPDDEILNIYNIPDIGCWIVELSSATDLCVSLYDGTVSELSEDTLDDPDEGEEDFPITSEQAIEAVLSVNPDAEIFSVELYVDETGLGLWFVDLASGEYFVVSAEDGTILDTGHWDDTDEGGEEDFPITSEQAIEAVLSVNPDAEILGVELYVDETGLGLWFVDLASGEYFVASAEDGTILDTGHWDDDSYDEDDWYEDDYNDDEWYEDDYDFDLCYDELTGEALDHECFDEECYDDFSAEEWCYDDDYSDDEWYDDDYSDDEWYDDESYGDDEWYDDDYSEDETWDDEWYDDDYSDDEWYDDDYSEDETWDDEWYDDDYSDDEWYDDSYDEDEWYDDSYDDDEWYDDESAMTLQHNSAA